MPYVRKKYRNGSPRTGKSPGPKSSRRRSTSKNYDSLTASFAASGGYPITPKRDARAAARKFTLPESVKLEYLLAQDRDNGQLAGPNVARFFQNLHREHPKIFGVLCQVANRHAA